MSNYVATYRRLDDNATRAETQADEYRQRADHDRWEQCRIAHEATTEGGYTYASFGKAVTADPTTISRQARIWRENSEPDTRPDYWTAMAEIRGHATGSERTRQMAISGARNLPAAEKAKLAAELLEDEDVEVAPAIIAKQAARPDVARAIARNDDAREAVEDHAIEHRARFANPERDARLREAPERTRQAMSRALGDETDLATDFLNGATNDLVQATLAKEKWGIKFPDKEAAALEKHDRALAIYRAEAPVTDDDRGWLESIGVNL